MTIKIISKSYIAHVSTDKEFKAIRKCIKKLSER